MFFWNGDDLPLSFVTAFATPESRAEFSLLLETADMEISLAVNAALHVYLFAGLLAQQAPDGYPFGFAHVAILLALPPLRWLGRTLLLSLRIIDLDDLYFLFGAGD